MAREIKFRAWDKQNKKMIYSGVDYALAYLQCDQNVPDKESFMGYGESEQTFFDIMQFTGLKDSNGAEIYEGDILMYLATNQSSMEVIFKDGCFYGEGPFTTHPLITYFTSLDFQSIEVIGNIYENPELLKS